MNRIGVLGHLAQGREMFDGQTVKTKEIVKEMKHNFSTVNIYDTYWIKQKKYKIISDIYKLFKNNDIIIICLHWNGYHKILPLVAIFQFIFKRRVFDFVIGGNRNINLKNNKIIKELETIFEKIYVESPRMVTAYNEMGIYNVEYMPNFKKLEINKEITYKEKDIIRACTCSRICKEKGIEEAINAVIKVNKKFNKTVCELTIYGQPNPEYANRMSILKNTSPEYIKFAGAIPPSQTVEFLKHMDLLVFPSYHAGEGFPGTIIDAYAAGLAIIATDWNFNRELVKDCVNGYIVPIKNVDKISEKIIKLFENRRLLYDMKIKSRDCASKYLTHNVLKTFIDKVNRENVE